MKQAVLPVTHAATGGRARCRTRLKYNGRFFFKCLQVRSLKQGPGCVLENANETKHVKITSTLGSLQSPPPPQIQCWFVQVLQNVGTAQF